MLRAQLEGELHLKQWLIMSCRCNMREAGVVLIVYLFWEAVGMDSGEVLPSTM